MSLNYESVEKGFECFSHIITTESGVMAKAYTERLPFPNFSLQKDNARNH